MNDKIKAQWIAQYFGEKYFMLPDWESFNDDRPMEIDYAYLVLESHYLTSGYLLLRTVDMLTDEEVLKIGRFIGWGIDHDSPNPNVKTMVFAMVRKDFLLHDNMPAKIKDFLRLLGILLPFTYLNELNQPVTLTPAQLIEMGWAKIKA